MTAEPMPDQQKRNDPARKDNSFQGAGVLVPRRQRAGRDRFPEWKEQYTSTTEGVVVAR